MSAGLTHPKRIFDEIIAARAAWGTKSARCRRKMCRAIRRAEHTDLRDILDDCRRAKQELVEELATHAMITNWEKFQGLLDTTFNQNNWLYIDSAQTQIEAALCTQDGDSHVDFDMFETLDEELENLEHYRHTSHLPEKSCITDDIFSSSEDITDDPVLIADISANRGLKVGSKLSASGNVYGKARFAHWLAKNDPADLAEAA